AYVSAAVRDIEQGCGTLSTGDTCICPASLDAALWAAGAARAGVDVVATTGRHGRHLGRVLDPAGGAAASDLAAIGGDLGPGCGGRSGPGRADPGTLN
ncbi:hypothetical protein LCGC14_2562040, partial [marine sediment metagenome]